MRQSAVAAFWEDVGGRGLQVLTYIYVHYKVGSFHNYDSICRFHFWVILVWRIYLLSRFICAAVKTMYPASIMSVLEPNAQCCSDTLSGTKKWLPQHPEHMPWWLPIPPWGKGTFIPFPQVREAALNKASQLCTGYLAGVKMHHIRLLISSSTSLPSHSPARPSPCPSSSSTPHSCPCSPFHCPVLLITECWMVVH